MENGCLMKVESIAECYPWSILQYFWPALSDDWYWKPFFLFFLSGRLRQGLLYVQQDMGNNKIESLIGVQGYKRLYLASLFWICYFAGLIQ